MIDGTYLLLVLAGFALLYLTLKLVAWGDWDDRRRHERLVHRNIMRQIGRWPQ